MGLFSSKSSSKSSTKVYDYSTNISADLSGGDLTAGASNNVVSGGDVYYAGLSDELATSFLNATVTNSNAVINANTELSNNYLSAVNKSTDALVDGAYDLTNNLLNAGIKSTDALVDGAYDLTNNLLNAGIKSTDALVDGAYDLTNNLLNAGIKSTGALVDGAIAITDKGYDYLKLLSNSAGQLFNDTFGWIQQTIGSAQQQTELVSSQLAQAYNSEQATHSAIKTYALYGLIGFLAYVYFVKRK